MSVLLPSFENTKYVARHFTHVPQILNIVKIKMNLNITAE